MLYAPPMTQPDRAARELTEKQMLRLFPTAMFTGKLPDITLCDRIERRLRTLQKSGAGTTLRTDGLRAYMTPDNIQDLPEMKDLVELVMAESASVLDVLGIKRDSHYITNMWANITHPNRRHGLHMHPNCVLSGLVYIKTPAKCGPTVFSSPRQMTKNLEFSYFVKNEFNADVFGMVPEKGRMLLWPSHVPHAVDEGRAEPSEDRIIVAFNIMIRGQIDVATAHLTLV